MADCFTARLRQKIPLVRNPCDTQFGKQPVVLLGHGIGAVDALLYARKNRLLISKFISLDGPFLHRNLLVHNPDYLRYRELYQQFKDEYHGRYPERLYLLRYLSSIDPHHLDLVDHDALIYYKIFYYMDRTYGKNPFLSEYLEDRILDYIKKKD